MHTHGSSKTAIDLEHSELVQVLNTTFRQLRIGDNLIICRRLDFLPDPEKCVSGLYQQIALQAYNSVPVARSAR